jgi:hypothetical protein
LIFSSLDGTIRREYTWLRGTPLAWQALQGDDQIYLVWRTAEEELWVALLSLQGEQLTAPIPLGSAVTSFAAAQRANGQVIVAWITGRRLLVRWVDHQGRPLPETDLEQPADDLALGINDQGTPLISWREGSNLGIGIIDLEKGSWLSRQAVTTFQLPADGWLADMNILSAGEEWFVIWGISRTEQPDTADYQGIMFSDATIQQPESFAITVPGANGLRWAVAQGNHLLLAGRLAEDWQPIKISFGTSGMEPFELIDGIPITGSPAGFQGEHVAWVSLDNLAQPRLYVTTQDKRFGKLLYPAEDHDWREAIQRGIKNSPYGLLWLILPIIGAVVLRGQWYVLPATTAIYWLGKWLIPLGMFRAYPPALYDVDLVSPFVISLITLFLITRLATLTAYVSWGKTPDSIRHAAYFLTDAFLTCVIFGASVK